MTQHHSDPARANDPHALPNVEVFHSDDRLTEDEHNLLEVGWYWWACFPGCLPDGEPVGPFATEAEALADATNSD